MPLDVEDVVMAAWIERKRWAEPEAVHLALFSITVTVGASTCRFSSSNQL
jgi:hypothetical protein